MTENVQRALEAYIRLTPAEREQFSLGIEAVNITMNVGVPQRKRGRKPVKPGEVLAPIEIQAVKEAGGQ